jgi:hypothetical protein
MTHVLLVPGALIFEPEWARIGPERVPERLARRLTGAARATCRFEARWSDGAAHLQWLAREFGVPGDPPATAPFAWQATTGQAMPLLPARSVWFCEPVHLSLEPERTVLAPIDTPPLTEAEAGQLFDEAADSARGHGVELRRAATRWYLFADPGWEVRATALQASLGASVEARLPQGAGALPWRRLLNEIQMRWHAHPINQQREARGQQAANALWLHGGGAWRALGPSRFARVDADDPVVLGWQQAARNGAGGPRPTDTLTVWAALFEPYWRRDWSAWAAGWEALDARLDALLRAARAGPDSRVELVACGRRAAATFVLDTGWTWRPWRRANLRECLLEVDA